MPVDAPATTLAELVSSDLEHVYNSPISCYSIASLHSFHLVDKNSGAVFQTISEVHHFPPSLHSQLIKITQGRNGFVSIQDIGFAGSKYDLDCLPITDSYPFLDNLVPTLALTAPTPIIPQSPIFVPQSPVTLDKFITASDAFLDETTTLTSPYAVPMLPHCEDCSLLRQHLDEVDVLEAPVQHWFCRACHKQWLACQVWYQASDGGKRQQLREPFIKPGEANNSNRAIMETLGIPTVSSKFFQAEAELSPMRFVNLIGIRDVSNGVGFGRRVGTVMNKKLRRSLNRTMSRFSGGERWAVVDEMGQVLDESAPRQSRRLSGVWDSVKATIRRRR